MNPLDILSVCDHVVPWLVVFYWSPSAPELAPCWSVFQVAAVCRQMFQEWMAQTGVSLVQNPPWGYRDCYGRRLLHVAAEKLAHQDLLCALVEARPSAVFKKDHQKWTPLHLMVMQTPVEPLETLDEADKQYWMRVHKRQECVVDHLLTLHPEASLEKDGKDRIPLHFACCCAPLAAMVMIGRNKSLAEKRDEEGRLPLHHAAMNLASTKLLRVLLKAHPPGGKKCDDYGKTPLDYAAKAVGKKRRCPQGHHLSSNLWCHIGDGVYCDACLKLLSTSAVFFSCDACQYDLCANCTPHAEAFSLLRVAASPSASEASAALAQEADILERRLQDIRRRQAQVTSGEADLYTILDGIGQRKTRFRQQFKYLGPAGRRVRRRYRQAGDDDDDDDDDDDNDDDDDDDDHDDDHDDDDDDDGGS